MIRFVYPNASPREQCFLGCGRFLVLPAGQQPAEEGYNPESLPNTPNLVPIQVAAGILAPEGRQSRARVYEEQDKPKRPYVGSSKDLAYLLTLIHRTRRLRCEGTCEDFDIWCMGTLDLDRNRSPLLKEVDPAGFDLKLHGFLDQREDKLFLVPVDNMTPSNLELCERHEVEILPLEKCRRSLRSSPMQEPKRKTVCTISAEKEELRLLRDTLFDKPRRFFGSPWFPWIIRIGVLLAALLAALVWFVRDPPPPLPPPKPTPLGSLIIEFPKPGKIPIGGAKSFGHHNLPLDTKVWILLQDRYGNYYLQNPLVRLERDGTWSQDHVVVGRDIVRIIIIQVTPHGNSEFEAKVKGRRWEGFSSLPEASTELDAVKIEVTAD